MSILKSLIQPVTSILDKFIPDADTKQKIAHEIATMAEKYAHETATLWETITSHAFIILNTQSFSPH